MQQHDGQYDFFMNASSGSKPSRLPGNGLNPKLFIAAIIGFVLVLVFGIVYLVMNSGKPDNELQIIRLAQQQTELIRVAELGLKEAREPKSKELAMTTSLSINSDLYTLKTTLRTAKVKVKEATLKEGKNPETDAKLKSAKENNRFDEVFLQTIQDQLVDYQKNMNATYKATTNKKLKEALKKQYHNASIIINVEPEE